MKNSRYMAVAMVMLSMALTACGTSDRVPDGTVYEDAEQEGDLSAFGLTGGGTAAEAEALARAMAVVPEYLPGTEGLQGNAIADTQLSGADRIPASPEVIPEDIMSARLELDYSGELFPGSDITAAQVEEGLKACGANLSIFTIEAGECSGQSYVYLMAEGEHEGIVSGVWGNGKMETAEAYLGALYQYCSELCSVAGEAGGPKAASAGSADISQEDIDHLCAGDSGDAVAFQDAENGKWYLATASWAGGGVSEISESQATAYAATGTLPQPPREATGISGQSGTPTSAADMLALVNEDRADNGIGGLSWSDDLAQTALQRVADVKANYDAWDGADEAAHAHDGAGNYNILGENAAAGQSGVAAANAAWMNSPAHHGNRLCDTDTEYACAYLYVPGSEYGYYWVEVFR